MAILIIFGVFCLTISVTALIIWSVTRIAKKFTLKK